MTGGHASPTSMSTGVFAPQFVPPSTDGLDLTQPENALFLDNEEDWGNALDEFDMEEEEALQDNRAAHRNPQQPQPEQQIQQDQGTQNDVEMEEESFEIEERDFLPPDKPVSSDEQSLIFTHVETQNGWTNRLTCFSVLYGHCSQNGGDSCLMSRCPHSIYFFYTHLKLFENTFLSA